MSRRIGLVVTCALIGLLWLAPGADPASAILLGGGGGGPVEPPDGGCCHEQICTIESEEDCSAIGGTYLGDGTPCSVDPEYSCIPHPCCLANGSCEMTPRQRCIHVLDGTFYTSGTCDSFVCPPPGACCIPGETCKRMPEAKCIVLAGVWKGAGTGCDADTCLGACCYSTGLCAEMLEENCTEADSVWKGAQTHCDPNNNPCPQPGACCFNNDYCESLIDTDCVSQGGFWMGAGVACVDCPPSGACCFATPGCQSGSLETNCDSQGGIWLGEDIACEACPPIGACCFVGASCNPYMTSEDCTSQDGAWQGASGTCSTCTGACCHTNGTCTILTESLCSEFPNATFKGTGTECATANCPPPGACCICCGSGGGTCYTDVTEPFCIAQQGTWQGDWSTACPNCTASCPLPPVAPSSCRGGDHPQGPAVAAGANCTNDDPGDFVSKCWYSNRSYFSWYPDGYLPWPQTGFPLNISLWQGFGPSDFPPLKVDPVASSSPLVSGEVRHFGGPLPYRERVTLNDIVDLATGVPLLQAVDFELPFGSATFRHIRTYSENCSLLYLKRHQGGLQNGGWPPEGTFWDWNGLFWMMSENPILLIDMQYADADDHSIPAAGPRCYLIPDAHHAIPFLWEAGTNNYTAPPWFDAVLTHNGTKDTSAGSTGGWEVLPTQFTVYLHRRSIKYTFEPHWEDVWEEPYWDPATQLS